MATDQVSGLVLAGGQSSRMGAEKGLLQLQGKPLVAYCRDVLTPWVETVYISANRSIVQYAAYGNVVQDDAVYGVFQGPLVGIASVMARIKTPWLFVIPVDTPVVPENVFPRLKAAALGADRDVAYVVTDRAHPLCMAIHVKCRNALHDYLMSGGRRVQAWLSSQRSIGVRFDSPGDKVCNVNTPEALEALEKALQRGGY